MTKDRYIKNVQDALADGVLDMSKADYAEALSEISDELSVMIDAAERELAEQEDRDEDD
jgi:hypothetical protein